MTRKRDLSNITLRHFIRVNDGDEGPTVTELRNLGVKINPQMMTCVNGSNLQKHCELIHASEEVIIALQTDRRKKHLKFEVYRLKTDGKAHLHKTRLVPRVSAPEPKKPVRRPKAN